MPKRISRHFQGTAPQMVCPFGMLTFALCSLVFFGCRKPTKPTSSEMVMAWRPIASWSGNANYQTDSFDIGTGQWRIKWQTTDHPSEKQKLFRVMVHSSVSGRFVSVAVDHPNAGSGIDYVAEDPRAFFLVVESKGLDWKLNVEEGIETER